MKALKLLLVLLIPLVVLVSCLDSLTGDDDDNDDDKATGTLVVEITDAPGDYDEVNVTFDEVSVHQSASGKLAVGRPEDTGDNGEAEDGDDTDGEEGEAGWYVISSEEQTINLLELTNGMTDVLGEKELEVGHYTQVRLAITAANVVVDGESYDLTVPSSSLKFNRPFTITEGIETKLVVDFDAERSVHKTGAGQYMLRPTIRIIQEDQTGRITGSVANADSQTVAYAIASGDTATSAFPDTAGMFVLGFLEAGSYDVSIVNGAGETYDQAGVAVTVGETTKLNELTLE